MFHVLSSSVIAIFALIIRCTSVHATNTLIKVDISKYPKAACLDGSPGGFYFRKAYAENASKWVFSLEGGGECVDLTSCQERANSSLGSSKSWPKTTTLFQLQAEQAEHNPDLHSYNQVFIKYCSGDLHMGQQIAVGASLPGLRFSGHHILTAILETLKDPQYGLLNASLIVFSGDSAGGLGTFANLDFVADYFPSAHVVGCPIGGFYFSNNKTYNGSNPNPISFIPWTFTALQKYYKLWDAFVPTRCFVQHKNTPWQCMFAVKSYITVKSPVFVIEAQTDRVVMPLHNGLPPVWDSFPFHCKNKISNCPQDILDFMATWKEEMGIAIKSVSKSDRDGLFHPACLIHTSFKIEQPLINGKNYLAAFTDWLFKRSKSHKYVDDCGVMCNPSCQGL